MCFRRVIGLALMAVFLVACKGEEGLERPEGGGTPSPPSWMLKYVGHRHRLRSNVFQIAETETLQWNTEGITREKVPAGGFLYSRDAMSGAGSDTSTPFSRYSFIAAIQRVLFSRISINLL